MSFFPLFLNLFKPLSKVGHDLDPMACREGHQQLVPRIVQWIDPLDRAVDVPGIGVDPADDGRLRQQGRVEKEVRVAGAVHGGIVDFFKVKQSGIFQGVPAAVLGYASCYVQWLRADTATSDKCYPWTVCRGTSGWL